MAEAFVEDDELVVSGTVNNGYSERNISGVRLCNFNIAKCDISLLVHGNGIGLSSDRDVYESMKLIMFISKKCMSELLDLREFVKCIDETTTSKESIMTIEFICANIRLDDNLLVIERYDLDKEMKFCLPPYVIKYLIEKFETGRVKFVAIDADEAEDSLVIKVYSYRDYRCQATIDIYDSSVSYWDWGVSLDDEYDFEVEL